MAIDEAKALNELLELMKNNPVTKNSQLNATDIANFQQQAQNDYNVMLANGIPEAAIKPALEKRYENVDLSGIQGATETKTANITELAELAQVQVNAGNLDPANDAINASRAADVIENLGIPREQAEQISNSMYGIDLSNSSNSNSPANGSTPTTLNSHDSCWGSVVGTGTDIDLTNAQSDCEAWKSANDFLKANGYDFLNANPFAPLAEFNPSLGGAYFKMLADSIYELVMESTKMQNATQTYVATLITGENDPPWLPAGPVGPGGGGGSGGNSGDPPNPPDNYDPSKPIIIPLLEKSNLKEINGIVSILKDISTNKKKGIDEILMDKTYADEIKKLLLASPNISDDLKKILTETDSEIIRMELEAIMKGEHSDVFDLSGLNLEVVYSYLEPIATKNNATVPDFLTDTKYSKSLKDTLSNFKDVASLMETWEAKGANECQANLLNIYDGNEISNTKESTVSIVRNFVEYVAKEVPISSEELLTDNKYAEVLKEGSSAFGKTSAFMNAISDCSNDKIPSIFKKVYGTRLQYIRE